MQRLRYMTDEALDDYKTNFDSKYLGLYTEGNLNGISKVFNDESKFFESDFEFEPSRLILETEVGSMDAVRQNIRLIRSDLGELTTVQAENEKMWVYLTNTVYLEYHLDQIKTIPYGANRDVSIKSRTIFMHGKKRSLVMNSLSTLWWIAYYTYDEVAEDPFHLTDFFLEEAYRGNAVSFLSSNIVSNKNIALGILDAIKRLVDEGKMIANRYSYTNSNKMLNRIGGVRVIDVLSRDQVKDIIYSNLLNTEKIRLVK